MNCSNLFHYQILLVGLLVILIDFMIFLSPFVILQGFISAVFFLAQFDSGILWLENVLTSDLNGFESRVDRHFLSLDFFNSSFLNPFHLFLHFSRVTL